MQIIAVFEGSARQSAQLPQLLTKRGPDQGYFLELSKSLFTSDLLGQEKAAKREFAIEGLTLNFVSGSRYLGACLGPKTELEARVKSQVEAWYHRVRMLGKISRQHAHSDYAGLGMLLQLEWQYLQRTVPGVGTLMGPIEEALRENFFPALFEGGVSTPTFGKSLAIA